MVKGKADSRKAKISSSRPKIASPRKDSLSGKDGYISSSAKTETLGSKVARKRGRLLLTIVVFILTICAIRLFDLQVVQASSLAEEATKARTSSTEIAAKRGDIVDRKGTVLATSIEVYNVSVNQLLVKNYIQSRSFFPRGRNSYRQI